MPCWYYEKKELRNTPSIQDGSDYETECRYRKEGARFIIDTGTKMDLGYNTMATGVVYFHRFYMFHSFKNFPRYVTACCCLFLAGKVEETPKKCKDIIKTAKTLLTEQKFMTFGEDPKEEVMTLERILLQTIKFDLQVEHPYSYLLKYAKCLKGDKNKLQKMVQMAWTFVNDSLCTTLSLQWEPEIIAVALMYLAGKLSKFEVVDWNGRQPKHLRWWDMFVEDVTMDLLEDICHQVLDLYSQANNAKPPDSPPTIPPNEQAKERTSSAPAVESASNTPTATPSKVIKLEGSTSAANGCQPAESTETLKTDASMSHFTPHTSTFPTTTTTAYPPVFPPTNTSVPPPSLNTINHAVTPIHHISTQASVRPTSTVTATMARPIPSVTPALLRPTPPATPSQPLFQQSQAYSYPGNSGGYPSGYSSGTPTQSSNSQHPYYPSQS